MSPLRRRHSPLGDLFTGAAYLPRGLYWVATRPGMWSLGIVPAVIAAIVLGLALVGLVLWIGTLAGWLTPFASSWPAANRDLVRSLLEVLLLIGGVWLAAVSFTALTLAIGQPFYERISERVERELGPLPSPAGSGRGAFRRSALNGLAVVALSAVSGLLLFGLGLVPVIGQTAGPVVAACVAGFWLANELTSPAFERRRWRFGRRMAVLRRHWPLTLGFGILTFLLFLVPLMAIVAIPGAVAGGTLMVRERLDVTGADPFASGR